MQLEDYQNVSQKGRVLKDRKQAYQEKLKINRIQQIRELMDRYGISFDELKEHFLDGTNSLEVLSYHRKILSHKKKHRESLDKLNQQKKQAQKKEVQE